MKTLVVAPNYRRFIHWLSQEENKQQKSLRKEYSYITDSHSLRGYRNMEIIILDEGSQNQKLMDELLHYQQANWVTIKWIQT